MVERKNIWLGLLALFFTVLAWLLVAGLSALGIYTEFYVPGGLDGVSDESPAVMLAGLIFVVAMAVNLVGLILAVVGLFSRREHRLFPVIVTMMSGILFLFVAILLVIGIVSGG